MTLLTDEASGLPTFGPHEPAELCFVCDGKLASHEARMWFPAHSVQTHMTCGETPRTFYTPVNSSLGPAATVWTHKQAEDSITEEIAAADEGDENMARENWTIEERTMTPAAYLQLPEWDGF